MKVHKLFKFIAHYIEKVLIEKFLKSLSCMQQCIPDSRNQHIRKHACCVQCVRNCVDGHFYTDVQGSMYVLSSLVCFNTADMGYVGVVPKMHEHTFIHSFIHLFKNSTHKKHIHRKLM